MKYPVYIPEITDTEKKYVNDCLDSTWISSKGKFVNLFEEKIVEFTGAKYAISVFNGTVALHLALEVLGIKEGDEVILPDFTYIASTNSVLYVKATPVLVDICPKTWNITLDEIKKHVTDKTKAILLTDIYGTPPEMDEIIAFAKSKNIFVIADSAESLGATSYQLQRILTEETQLILDQAGTPRSPSRSSGAGTAFPRGTGVPLLGENKFGIYYEYSGNRTSQ